MNVRHLLPLVLVLGCGGAGPASPAKTPAAEPETSSKSAAASEGSSLESSEPAAGSLPTNCAKATGTCLPPPQWVKRLCAKAHPTVALSLFAPQTPWVRAYVNRKVEAVNASGGVTAEGTLEPGEEVLILEERIPDAGGMQVSGAGGYYVFRWDGSCNDLAAEEVQHTAPSEPKAAPVQFRYLEDPAQETLRQDPAVEQAVLARKKECKGATTGEVSKKCVVADQQLSRSIVAAVRGGIALPTPQNVP